MNRRGWNIMQRVMGKKEAWVGQELIPTYFLPKIFHFFLLSIYSLVLSIDRLLYPQDGSTASSIVAWGFGLPLLWVDRYFYLFEMRMVIVIRKEKTWISSTLSLASLDLNSIGSIRCGPWVVMPPFHPTIGLFNGRSSISDIIARLACSCLPLSLWWRKPSSYSKSLKFPGSSPAFARWRCSSDLLWTLCGKSSSVLWPSSDR